MSHLDRKGAEKVKKLRLLLLAATAGLCLALLSGCSLKSPEDLYTLPRPPEEYDLLQQAITRVQQELGTTYSTTVEYAAPLSGVNIQPIQMLDLDDDGVQESAAAFFRVTGAENPLMIYLFRQAPDGGYEVYAVIEGGGSAINRVSYEDLDGAPGKEIVVHWQMSDDVHLLGAYSLSTGSVRALLITSYTDYALLDMDMDGKMELMLVTLGADGAGRADYYDYSAEMDSLVLDSTAPLSTGLTGVEELETNFVMDMLPALYVTGRLSSGGLITDILVNGENGLSNVTLDPVTGSSTRTLCLRDVFGTDINSDAVLELPGLTFLPEYGVPLSTDSMWTITWMQYDAQGTAHPVCTTYHNERDGWYLILPDIWQGQLTLLRTDQLNRGERAVTFCRWSGAAEEEPEAFLTIYTLTGTNRAVRAALGDRFTLMEDSTTIYAAEFQGDWDCGLDEESLLANFNLIRTEW